MADCTAKLRQWVGAGSIDGNKESKEEGIHDGRPIGPTMRIEPGHTYQAQITNKLPKPTDKQRAEHARHIGGHSGGESHGVLGYIPPKRTDTNHNLDLSSNSNEINSAIFNIVNIHTHGWHVDPRGNSDNIFRTMEPGGPEAITLDNKKAVYEQKVYLPTYHPSGSFWYHSHVHGSTTIQVASGMAGALIVEDNSKGLDPILNIKKENDRIMVFQQLAYGEDSKIENYDFLHQGGNKNLPGAGYSSLNRPVFINGQAYPKISITKGEIQRWRFIYAGMTNAINPQLIRADMTEEEDKNKQVKEVINMHEIALDGFPTGTMPAIPYARLASGYRTDVWCAFRQVQELWERMRPFGWSTRTRG